MQRILAILFLFLSSFVALAQNGTLRGKVSDAATKEPMIGATVVLEGTSLGAAVDVEGDFEIANVPAGKYNLIISAVGYSSKKVEGIEVFAGKATTISTDLQEDVNQLGEVVIVAAKETNTVVSVLREIREAEQVVSGISAEQIKRSLDGTAAQVMTRVPGITIIDNRFVMIRGVSDRYNAVMINNAFAPSTEINSRSFAFDLIPSNIIDRMLVYKSGAAEFPGDFAGGVIKLYTRDAVDENFFDVTIAGGFRQNTTFSPYFSTQGSSTDFLGFDNGFRSIPDNFPSNLRDFSRSSPELQAAGRSLTNNFQANESTAAPDFRLGFTLGRKFSLFGKDASNLTSVNYSNFGQFMQIERFRYAQFNPSLGESPQLYNFNDRLYGRYVRLGLISNFNIIFNEKNSLSFKNTFNQLSENETTLREGFNIFQRPELFNNAAYYYLSRSIYSSQLAGRHDLSERSSLNWVLALNYTRRNEPDFRRFRRIEDQNEPGSFVLIDPPSANPFDAGRFYSRLNEYQAGNGVNFEYKLGNNIEDKPKLLKAGYYVDYRYRDFSARYFSYTLPTGVNPDIREGLVRLPNNTIFNPENISAQDGFVVDEGTNASDTYTGTNLLSAAYASLTLPLNQWNIAFGARLEYNIQTLNSSLQGGQAVEVNNPILAPLPFVNIAYNLSEQSLLRVAYSRTLNRPEFRELAPFLFYDFNLDVNFSGNPDLETAFIDNADLRFEYYPSESETFSVGAFYKRFTNPIEQRVSQVADGQQFGYINADFATNVGVEAEMRKGFAKASSAFLQQLTLVLNASYIYSRVDLGAATVGQDRVRALQGQSPYIFNLAAFWSNPKSGWNVNAFYNIFGERIFAVGDNIFPTIYELPRHSIDLTVGKTLRENLELKAGVQDLLNFRYRFYQDSDRNGKIDTSIDEPIILFRRGTLYNMSLTYKF